MSEGAAGGRSALVLTASDRSAAGTREDASGDALSQRLEGLGFAVERAVVADDRTQIAARLRDASEPSRADRHDRRHRPDAPRRDAPATLDVVDYEVPPAEAMRAEGRAKTVRRALSRSVVGGPADPDRQHAGQPEGAMDVRRIVPVLDHALETLAGPFDHGAGGAG
jgi:cyclic pyranopterin phosphate synthase